LSEPPLVAFAGRLSPEKGLRVLLRAFQLVVQRVPGVRLSIVGSGPERPSIEQLARELGVGDQIELTGHLEKAEMENRLERAWVQAVPSLWHEPFPNVATEAMMRGTSVVASHMGGLPEIVEPGETGYLVPARDVPSLAGALTEIMADRGLAERLGEAGRRRALRLFSMESSASRFEKLYAGMLQ
jgi:glycosyltransferase involved in cell wall biosynthesis